MYANFIDGSQRFVGTQTQTLAGLVPGDGETHQGIYDTAFLSQIEGLPLVSVCNYEELDFWLEKLLLHTDGPRALRYPRGGQDEVLACLLYTSTILMILFGSGG